MRGKIDAVSLPATSSLNSGTTSGVNLFKPLFLFFYLGFIVPLLKIDFEFPHVMYQGLTIYLLISDWLAWRRVNLPSFQGSMRPVALMFMAVGFCTNFVIGALAYFILRKFIPKMRRVDSATVAAYYGSDSAGTFVTCLGVLAAASINYAPYMPVMLAIMEIPGCLVGLWLRIGSPALGNGCPGKYAGRGRLQSSGRFSVGGRNRRRRGSRAQVIRAEGH